MVDELIAVYARKLVEWIYNPNRSYDEINRAHDELMRKIDDAIRMAAQKELQSRDHIANS